MRKEPDTPQGTIALLAVYLLIIVFLWSNVYFTMRSRGVNTPTSFITSPLIEVLESGQSTGHVAQGLAL